MRPIRIQPRVPSEAIADGIHSAIGRPARHTSFATGTALLIRKPERKVELQLWVLLEIRYGDRQKRDGLLIRMLREHHAHQFFCELGKDCCRRNRRAERDRMADGAQVGEANPDRHRSAGRDLARSRCKSCPPDGAEPGFQERLSRMGAPAAD